MPLLAELKRRNVFRVSIAYLALGWVVTEVSNTIVPLLNLPQSIPATLLWIGLAGFPFVVMFSWAYELTPEGLKRESEVDRSQSIMHVTSKRLDYITIGLLVLAIGLFAFHEFRPSQAVAVSDPAIVQPDATPVVAIPAPASQSAVVAAPNEKSIAVLPFVNMSSDMEQEYFSDGISEELLNLLAKIPELKVIARTSSFAFKGKEVDIAEIATKLNVAHVLEGSVRKSGNTVRITAQLIRTVDSTHLWSETYDRPLDNIFAVQDEIAGAVVEQLKIKLLGAAPKAKPVDAQAYALYLQARQLERQGAPESFQQAIALYQQALKIEPVYAQAWSGLASTYNSQTDLGLRPYAEGYSMARDAAMKALAIGPDFAPAHANLGNVAMNFDGDLATSALQFEQALALEPANAEIIGGAAFLARALGQLDAAIALREYARVLDPVSAGGHVQLGVDYIDAGRLDDAITSLQTAVSMSPGYSSAHFRMAQALLLKGDFEAALAAMRLEESDVWRMIGMPMVHHALGQHAESDAALEALTKKHDKEAAYNIAYAFAYRGETDRAFEWLEKAIPTKDPGLSDVPVEPLFTNIHNDPRWLPFLRKIGRAPEQLAAIPFEVKLPTVPAH